MSAVTSTTATSTWRPCLAAFKLRAVPVNVNFRYVDEELAYLFDNADLKVVVTEPDLEERAAPRRGDPRLGLPGGGRRRRLRGPAGGAARHGACSRRTIARRPLRPLDRWHHGHAEGCDVAPRGHLPVRDRRGREPRPRDRAGDRSRRRRSPRGQGFTDPRHAEPLPPHARWRLLADLLGAVLRHLRRGDPRHRVRSRLRDAGRRRGADQPRDDHRRCVRAADRRPADGRWSRGVRPLPSPDLRVGRRDPVAVGEGRPRPGAPEHDRP